MVIERNSVPSRPAIAAGDVSHVLDVASCDWDELYAAVLVRLRRFAVETATPPTADTALREGVQDCVAALEQLQLTLAHEVSLRLEAEARVAELRLALQQATLELAELRATGHHARHQAQFEDSGRSACSSQPHSALR